MRVKSQTIRPNRAIEGGEGSFDKQSKLIKSVFIKGRYEDVKLSLVILIILFSSTTLPLLLGFKLTSQFSCFQPKCYNQSCPFYKSVQTDLGSL